MPSAQELLDIYRRRLRLAEEGISHPLPGIIETTKTLVAELARLDPHESIGIADTNGTGVFSVEATGEVIATFQDDEKSPAEVAHRQQWFDEYWGELKDSLLRAPEPGRRFACPCCRFFTLGERGGFEICPVCFWEDDGQDDHDPGVVRGGPNGGLSLERARTNYAAFGACDERWKSNVRLATPHERGEDP